MAYVSLDLNLEKSLSEGWGDFDPKGRMHQEENRNHLLQ